MGIEGIQDGDAVCPWNFGELDAHVPNNIDRTDVVKDGKMTEAEGCTEIPASWPDLQYVREFEAEPNVNRGGA